MELIEIGKVTKPHGYKGEIAVWLDFGDPAVAKEIDFVFLQVAGRDVPHRVERHSHKKDKTHRLKLVGIDSEAQARNLTGVRISVSSALELDFSKPADDLERLIGFEVIDTEEGYLGDVDHVSTPDINPVLVIKSGYTEILVPFNESTLQKIDEHSQKITVTCPEGLIDLYRK
ncbi:MAG: 16S rRNA processing protein RimM [Flavobacteriales bacterium]|nr:16S rRNA processing protein RimM [Flavobacteriales bacterium]